MLVLLPSSNASSNVNNGKTLSDMKIQSLILYNIFQRIFSVQVKKKRTFGQRSVERTKSFTATGVFFSFMK